MVTVEIALGLPILLVVTLVAAWILSLGQTQARLTDAARATAREAARGASDSQSIAAGNRVVAGARLSVTRSGEVVTGHAEDWVSAPGPFLGSLRRQITADVSTTVESP